MKVRKAGPTTMVSRAKELYKEDAKDGDAEERGDLFFFFNRWLHRISRILAVLGYEDGARRPATMTSRAGVMGMGGRYKDERGMEAGGRVRPATVASRVLCLRRWGPSNKRGGSDGEEEKY